MNNIEILEHIAIAYIDDEEFSQYVSPEGRFITNKQLAQAVENLIKENKELKEHLQKYYNGELYTAKQLKNIEENQRKYFIHKSKVKEKIEELFNEMDELNEEEFDEDIVNDKRNLQDTIIVLKELLKEGE